MLNKDLENPKKTPLEKLGHGVINTVGRYYNIARSVTEDGMNDLSEARKNENATVYENLDNLEDKSLKNKLKSLGVPESSKGVYYNEYSDAAKDISQAPELDNYINNFIKGNINGNNVIEFNKNKNLHYAFQHMTVHNPRIVNGEFECEIVDYLDFTRRIPDGESSDFGKIPNNWGDNMQKKGFYKPYFAVIKIRKRLF